MHETYSLNKDGGSVKDFIKISDPQQCLLKLTGRNCCSSYMKYLREGSCSLVEIGKTICEVSSGKSNHATCLPLECWKSQ